MFGNQRMTARRPMLRSLLAQQANPPVYVVGYEPQHSGVYRTLSSADKTYLADRTNHMRNVYLAINLGYSVPGYMQDVTRNDEMIAGMAATGLLGDDGDAGTKRGRKFAEAMTYARQWLLAHPLPGPTPWP